ncbi:ABC transporter ATP-binding protein [Mergibacter septicus]|uniref:ABC transporter ATP-binding protein/permease n=1 Tax=Mergibacter septicus TaxID=221402 RepID=UPI0011794D0B|nr:ABC transporter ATP-binding protein/permease [Mergibacter septicus]AWX14389.1 ABC transporter ATP-binding protein [Mergibacter septicus]
MNLTQEALTSTIWVAKAFIITLICSGIAGYFVIKLTDWGKQFWLLGKDYFSPKRSLRPLLGFSFILILTLFSVRIDVIFSQWYNTMYDALQKLDENKFWEQMIWFAIIAGINLANVLFIYYIKQRFLIQWRQWLNDNLLDKWLENNAYYKIQYSNDQLDNPDQRIQQDIQSYVNNSLSLSTGVISSLVSLVAFTVILWNLSGSMQIAGIEIPHLLVFLVFIYVLITSIFAFKLGRPLIQLNFDNEKFNANYRYSLIRLKEYAESISFYRGEKVERVLLNSQFAKIIDNVWKLVFRTLKLSGFNVIVSQISVIFPFLIQANRFFSKQITLGDMVQTAQAFGQVHSSLSFFRNSYDEFTAYRATLRRLAGFVNAINDSHQTGNLEHHPNTDAIIFEQVQLRKPDGSKLLTPLNLTIQAGEKVLIQGPSGAGKTTLLRAIAGLWQYADGTIYCPEDRLFLSQRPYLPQGSLLEALYYPQEIPTDDNLISSAKQTLQQVHLAHLTENLLESNDWNRTLSPGEQQRLAIARLLLRKPAVAFLDEATASMDEGLEYEMYQLINQQLPNSTIISIGHRSTLYTHHTYRLILTKDKNWEFSILSL